MKKGADFLGQLSKLDHREDRSGLVVRRHDRDDRHARGEGGLISVEVEPAVAIHRDPMHLDAARLLKVGAKRQHGRMLDCGSHDLCALRHHLERREDRGVVAFRPARGEGDLVLELRSDQRLHPQARLSHRRPGGSAKIVARRRVAELVGKNGSIA